MKHTFQPDSQAKQYAPMLNVAIPPGVAPTWHKLGTEADDFVHTVAQVGDGVPLAFRSGVACWLDDMVTQGADRDLLTAFVTNAMAIRSGRNQPWFSMGF